MIRNDIVVTEWNENVYIVGKRQENRCKKKCMKRRKSCKCKASGKICIGFYMGLDAWIPGVFSTFPQFHRTPLIHPIWTNKSAYTICIHLRPKSKNLRLYFKKRKFFCVWNVKCYIQVILHHLINNYKKFVRLNIKAFVNVPGKICSWNSKIRIQRHRHTFE